MKKSAAKLSKDSSNGRRRVLFVTDCYIEDVLLGVVDYGRTPEWVVNASMRFHSNLPDEGEADGIIATVTRDARVRDWLQRWKCPIVRVIDSDFDLAYPAVESDYRAIGRAGARHLLDLGHTDFGFCWAEEVGGGREMRQGFEAEIVSAGRCVHWLDLVCAGPSSNRKVYDRAARCARIAQKLKKFPKPIAIMGDDDRRSLDIIDACRLANLRVPEDVAVLGCYNHGVEQRMARIPLSSVDVDFQRLGWEAAAMLAALMDGERSEPKTVRIPPRGVVARRTTATFVSDEPRITTALLHLREHFREQIRIPQLARIAGMSVRAFENEFKRCVGRTARDELRQARLACVSCLLRDTDLKLEAIAMESGFNSGKQMSVAFSEVHGVTPNAWRLQVQR